MRASFMRAAGLNDVLRQAAELSARTMIFDIEPLVAYWDSGQGALDQGIARVLSEVAVLPALEVLCFATNSARRPSAVSRSSEVQVVYLASAGKPWRTAPYLGFPRPGMVVGDQVPTDGILARRLGYVFVMVDPQLTDVPTGPRLMAAGGRLVRPLLFRPEGSAGHTRAEALRRPPWADPVTQVRRGRGMIVHKSAGMLSDS